MTHKLVITVAFIEVGDAVQCTHAHSVKKRPVRAMVDPLSTIELFCDVSSAVPDNMAAFQLAL
jgi:hypothetical protein